MRGARTFFSPLPGIPRIDWFIPKLRDFRFQFSAFHQPLFNNQPRTLQVTFSQRGLLLCRKVAFLRTPAGKRVRLELETDGRQITFLLVSLHALGYAVHVVGSPMVYRDLLALRHSTAIPFIIGGKPRRCAVAISDSRHALDQSDCPRKLLLDYDYFNPEPRSPRMPYFMHPAVYAAGLHDLAVPPSEEPRKIRIAFFGSRDAKFYTRDFHFPILNREQILEVFLSEFKDQIWKVDAPVSDWKEKEIAVAIDSKGGDRAGKNFLPMEEYLKALKQCDFFLSPPGCCMPLSHNLVEGMATGCIPIINCSVFLEPPLEDGVNCLVFKDAASLERLVRLALEMSGLQLEAMRRNVMAYYRDYLEPGVWLERILTESCCPTSILVNAEEVSMGIRTPTLSFVYE